MCAETFALEVQFTRLLSMLQQCYHISLFHHAGETAGRENVRLAEKRRLQAFGVAEGELFLLDLYGKSEDTPACESGFECPRHVHRH
jgi:hypothetical protein